MEGCIMNRRTISILALVASGVLLGATSSFGQSYPTKYVRIITGSAGTFHDVVARGLAQRLSERWGHSVIVTNQPGAGLTIGTAMAAKAAPDGYTLLLGDRTSLAAAPSLYKSLPYDPVIDLSPITLVARAPMVLALHPSVPSNSLAEFVAYLRKVPNPVPYASSGPGTVSHFAGVQFQQVAAVKSLIVQYKGGGAAVIALLGGESRFSFAAVPAALPHIKSGKLKALAITAASRFDGTPEIPTASEAGLSGLEADQWVAMLAPAGTPSGIVQKVNRDLVEILRTSAFRNILQAQGATAATGTPAELAAFMASETVRLRNLIAASGLSVH
jgi:tripartite-type tricarboxylate transporter receptor subunit TctC